MPKQLYNLLKTALDTCSWSALHSFFWTILLIATPLSAEQSSPSVESKEQELLPPTPSPTLENVAQAKPRITIYNRLLWSYRGSMITLLDLVRQLDSYLERNGQKEASSQVKYEFYQHYWRHILQDMIDNELVYQDALDHGMQISEGQAKEELARQYGEDYLAALDAQGWTLEETLEKIKKEMLTQQNYYFRVHYYARDQVTPAMVVQAYRDFIQKNPETYLWRYRLLTYKGIDALERASQASAKLRQGLSLEALMESESLKPDNLGRPLEQSSQQLNARILQPLQTLLPGETSGPIDFSRTPVEPLVRVVVLLEKLHQPAPSFAQLQPMLEEQLLAQVVEKQAQRYLGRLRRQLEREEGESLHQAFHPSTPLFSLH